MTAETEPRLLESHEVCELINVSPHTLAYLRLTGEGPPYVRVHKRRYLYPADGLQAYLAASAAA